MYNMTAFLMQEYSEHKVEYDVGHNSQNVEF